MKTPKSTNIMASEVGRIVTAVREIPFSELSPQAQEDLFQSLCAQVVNLENALILSEKEKSVLENEYIKLLITKGAPTILDEDVPVSAGEAFR